MSPPRLHRSAARLDRATALDDAVNGRDDLRRPLEGTPARDIALGSLLRFRADPPSTGR
ncbi:hypothetical protein [Sorangium sp. So ce1000]|uniref:hypothetical protein n=1 Tax=Sorangium sp. So ce1000 TaxID=3133325 RepID=UPI003F5F032C